MDPVSAIASVIGVLDVALRTTSALVNYADDARGASTERRILAEEAACLSTILQKLLDRARGKTLDWSWLESRKDLARQFRRAYDDLAAALNLDVTTGQLRPESRFKAIRTSAKWSFSKSEVYSLIERVTRLQQYANMILLNDQSDMLEAMEQMQQQAMEDKVKTAILSWLSPLQMNRVHQSIAERAQQGSGRWFLNSERFSHWRSGNEKLLWCSGIPGAGKTVIASIVIDHLRYQRSQSQDHSDIGIAFIYLKYNDPEQSLNNILASLLKQLIQEQGPLPSIVSKLYESYGDLGITPSSKDISEALLHSLSQYSEVFFIIDALDECSDETRWDIIEKLREFQSKVCILILSRSRGDIDEELKDFKRLEIKADKADIELFVDAQIQKNANLRRIIERSPSLRGDIKEGVVRTAKEMFLLARLHVESLASAAALSIRHVRNRLKTLPTTLMVTYDEAMHRIVNQDDECKSIALKALAWVNYAFRSLSLKELQHALAVEPGGSELDEELIMDERNITALCAGLITVDPGTDAVNFVHYTAYDYFEEKRQAYFPYFHGNITMSCATYLTMPALQNATIGTIVRKFPLACYAAQYMGDHARQNPEETLEQSILEAVCQLLASSGKRKPLLSLLDGLDLIKSGFYSPGNETLPEDNLDDEGDVGSLSVTEPELPGSQTSKLLEVTALHLAASMGLAKVASMLLKETPNIDAVDENGKTALAVAIERGFEKAVEILVNSGARVDLHGLHGQQVFLLLVEKRWSVVADVVAERAKAANVANDSDVSIMVSAYSGDVVSVSQLLTQGSMNKEDQCARELALFVAVERADPEMVQTLLSSNVDVNSRDNTGQTSLHRATRGESENIMRILLDHGAEVDMMNDEWHTAWSAHINSRNDKILGILLRAGANPNRRDQDGATVLYSAAAGGHIDVVKFLLRSGTNPSLRTAFDWAPLHWASYHGHIECVKLLLDAGAEPSPVSDQGTTPLDLAFRNNQRAVSDILVQTGAKEAKEIPLETSNTSIEDLEDTEGFVNLIETADALTLIEAATVRSDMVMTLTFDRPLEQSLVIGQFIYPDRHQSATLDIHDFAGEKTQPYQISHMLDSSVPTMSVRRSVNRPPMGVYPLAPEKFVRENILYDISCVSTDYQEMDLQGSSGASLPGTIRMRRGWSGVWKAHHEHEGSTILLFRTTPEWSQSENQGSRWTTEDGKLLARTGGELEHKMRVDHVLDPELLDALVACWIAKQWSNIVTTHKG